MLLFVGHSVDEKIYLIQVMQWCLKNIATCQKHQVELSMNAITVSDLTFSYFKRQLKQLAEKEHCLMTINSGSKISLVFKI